MAYTCSVLIIVRFNASSVARHRADKDSKLCNVLFTLEAQRRLSARKSKVKVDCFSPGLIPSSGLFRNQNPIFSKIFDLAATYVLKVNFRFECFLALCVEKVHPDSGNHARPKMK